MGNRAKFILCQGRYRQYWKKVLTLSSKQHLTELLDRLNISFVSLRDASDAGRTDAEYYNKTYIANENLFNILDTVSLASLCDISDGNHASIAENFSSEHGVPYFRGGDLKSFFIEEATPIKIPYNIFKSNLMQRSHLKQSDVLLSIVGTIGSVSLVTDTIYATCNCKIAILRPKNVDFSCYLSVFLMCKYGQEQIHRNVRGTVQGGLILDDLPKIKIPQLANDFIMIIKSIIKKSISLNADSKVVSTQAQNLLLSELDLVDYKPKHRTVYTKTLQEVFESKRMDAEYFQPKYADIENRIKGYKGGYSRIFEKFTHNKQMFKNPQNDTEYLYTEISDVNVSTGEVDSNLIPAKELPDNAKRILQKGDLIISKVRTYRGGIGIVSQDNVIGSGAFTVLQENKNSDYNIETLFAFLRLKPILEWTLKPNTGTSYPVIVDNDILNMLIPNISLSLQTEIAENIQKSNFARKQSRRLLDIAKQAVEMAIEQNEQIATEFINAECKKIGVTIE
jgi:type I restriction enzyme, S subunit